jgi:hypothetical protein
MTSNAIVASRLFEYVKLVEMTIVMVLSSVEYEHTFFRMSFMKFKHHNLLATNLDLVVCMYAQQFYMMQFFPFYIRLFVSGLREKFCMVDNTSWLEF